MTGDVDGVLGLQSHPSTANPGGREPHGAHLHALDDLADLAFGVRTKGFGSDVAE